MLIFRSIIKKIYSGILIGLLSTSIHAQGVDLEWARSLGAIDSDHGYSVAADSSGNVYVTGKYQGTVDFDPAAGTFNLTSNGLTEIFIQELEAGGNLSWARSVGEQQRIRAIPSQPMPRTMCM